VPWLRLDNAVLRGESGSAELRCETGAVVLVTYRAGAFALERVERLLSDRRALPGSGALDDPQEAVQALVDWMAMAAPA
jgi:hypothetical protein